MKKLKGIAASPGIGVGEAAILTGPRRSLNNAPFKRIHTSQVTQELQRFQRAVRKAETQIKEIMEELDPISGKDAIYILETHLMILNDRMLLDQVEDLIKNKRYSAEFALRTAHEKLRRVLDEIDDEYIRERRTDFDYVAERIFNNLSGKETVVTELPQGDIVVVAHDISPGEIARLSRKSIKAIATEAGSLISHTSIIARAFQIPAVVGINGLLDFVRDGDTVAVDGTEGTVTLNPGSGTLREIITRRNAYEEYARSLTSSALLSSQTADGVRIHLMVNIELPEEARFVVDYRTDGIGLYRTEYLYLGRKRLPTEMEHYRNYLKIINTIGSLPFTIRTFDLGAEKLLDAKNGEDEPNPALGLRAIRFSLARPHIFVKQLRGILRASAHGNVRILLPLITDVAEIREVKELLTKQMARLSQAGIPFNPHIPIGVMMETPSACLLRHAIVKEVDFLSIGTNDLVQYTLAADRTNEKVSYLFKPTSPSVLKLMEMVLEAAKKEKREVEVCGEVAGEVKYLPLLIGMGFRHLSMSPPFIPRIKKALTFLRANECHRAYQEVKKLNCAEEIDDFLNKTVLKMLPEQLIR